MKNKNKIKLNTMNRGVAMNLRERKQMRNEDGSINIRHVLK